MQYYSNSETIGNLCETPHFLAKPYTQTIYPWLVWLLGSSFFFYKYLVQVSPSVMTADLMQAFHIHATGLGNLSACYFYAYLLMQIPVGILLDKYSPRYLTAAAIFMCGVSTLVFSQAASLGLASFSRAIMGFCAAFAAVSCLKLATLWFPAKRFALVSGMCMTAAMLGAVNGQVPLSFLVQHFNWRTALVIIGFLGILLSLLYLTLVRDKAEPTPRLQSTRMKLSLKTVIGHKQAWLLSGYSGLAFAPVSVFGGLWGIPFLQQAQALSASQAAFAVSSIFIGFAMGAPFWGWLSDALKRRKPIMLWGTVVALVSLMVVLYCPLYQVKIISIILFLFGFGASGFFTSFAMIREVFPIALAATVLGFMNTFDSICEAFSEPLVGAVLDWTWQGAIAHNIHQFSTRGYQLSLSLLPLYLVAALVILYFIQETYCQTREVAE